VVPSAVHVCSAHACSALALHAAYAHARCAVSCCCCRPGGHGGLPADPAAPLAAAHDHAPGRHHACRYHRRCVLSVLLAWPFMPSR
jgi:hypothetical protein